MNARWEVIYKRGWSEKHGTVVIRPKQANPVVQAIGFTMIALALGGIVGPYIPEARLEAGYAVSQVVPKATPTPMPALSITNPAIEKQFQLIIPKIGVDSPVIANVNPTDPKTYDPALLEGVAHSSLSYFPDQNGTVYLFSHSTNYDWFVKELNAVFYLLKDLKTGDTVTILYKGTKYDYRVTGTKIVAATDTSYLAPVAGTKELILETCWPPGTTAERLLVFAKPMN